MTVSTITVIPETFGTSDFVPRIVRVSTDGTYSDVIAAGFVNLAQVTNPEISFNTTDVFFVSYSGSLFQIFTPSIDSSGVVTLTQSNSLSSQVAMTAAQFNGMYAAPVLLVAAPGANKMIIVNNIQLVMTYGSAAFAAGGVVAAQYDSTANGAGVNASTTEAAADFFQTASTVFKLGQGLVLSPFSTCANKGIYLSNLTQAFTTGTGSSFIVKTNYKVISTTV
jgi:hypothetical protein